MLVTLWHVLSQQEADNHAQVEAVTRKLLNWISHTGVTPGKKRDRLLLLYHDLDQLGFSEDVEEINYYDALPVFAAETTSRGTTEGMNRGAHPADSCLPPLFFSVKVRQSVCIHTVHTALTLVRLRRFWPEACLARSSVQFLPASRVGDTALTTVGERSASLPTLVKDRCSRYRLLHAPGINRHFSASPKPQALKEKLKLLRE